MDVAEPTLVQALRSHRGEVTCVDASIARMVTGGGDRTIRLWRWRAGAGWEEAAAAPAAHRYGITAARFAPTGVLIASGGVDGNLRVWCGRSLAARRLLSAPSAVAVRALCWAAEGARLLAGHDDGSLCVWNVSRGALLSRLTAHEGALHAVSVLARGALLLTTCTHGVLKVFDLAEVCTSGLDGSMVALEWRDGVHDLGALCADATEDGTLCATGGHDARVCVWRAVREGGVWSVRGAGVLEGHTAAVTSLRWASPLLASGSLDRTARLWSSAEGACLRVVHAHPRYLTSVVLAPDNAYLITGSNDKSIRMWSLGSFSLSDELEPACETLSHFALGDLEGIGPVEEEGPEEESPARAEECGDAQLVATVPLAHAGAVNCIAVSGRRLATASSDGSVKIFRWEEETSELVEEHVLEGHQYPVLAVDFGAAGQLLLSAGLDGCAYVWDVETGVMLRSLCVPSGSGEGGETGGGGVRGARVSPHRPPLLLLATDDGLAPLWSLASSDPAPRHVYTGHSEAVTCCAWSADGRLLATGAASGELRLHTPPPAALTLHHDSHAHDLGVQSCDFASPAAILELPQDGYFLATGGNDSLLKLWLIRLNEDGDRAEVRLVRQVEAHGGGVSCVRWGGAGALVSAGADRWARVWRGAGLEAHAAAEGSGAGGALAAALFADLLAVGSLGGALAVWRVPPPAARAEDDCTAPRFWGLAGVTRWLHEYVIHPPGALMTHEEKTVLMRRAQDLALTGAQLLDVPVDELLDDLGYGEAAPEDGQECSKQELERAETRARLRAELDWLRTDTTLLPSAAAPHRLRCPLTHRVLREPARAPDGFTYERAAIVQWFIAAEGAVSPVSGRRMRSVLVSPNYSLRDQLRTFIQENSSV
ncbi:WD repeat, SAM and U-box domain-containing protein 1-like isoform X1 [Bombyx mandarina]|uniref:WD repeat, SAM and U-box domain-containing protein 1-like isoform X1 n=1 Tax=Bombyx mandarina TaxID=7092 RepID=A0A6J2KJ44_BOMMA|nr:WD repeat, SAM and U-box domain-containing protein 1-like isoform X1 [Bombyx mandarina]